MTFDSGGISIKPSSGMGEMRADMMGASNVVATMMAVAQLKLPINVIGWYSNDNYFKIWIKKGLDSWDILNLDD